MANAIFRKQLAFNQEKWQIIQEFMDKNNLTNFTELVWNSINFYIIHR